MFWKEGSLIEWHIHIAQIAGQSWIWWKLFELISNFFDFVKSYAEIWGYQSWYLYLKWDPWDCTTVFYSETKHSVVLEKQLRN